MSQICLALVDKLALIFIISPVADILRRSCSETGLSRHCQVPLQPRGQRGDHRGDGAPHVDGLPSNVLEIRDQLWPDAPHSQTADWRSVLHRREGKIFLSIDEII